MKFLTGEFISFSQFSKIESFIYRTPLYSSDNVINGNLGLYCSTEKDSEMAMIQYYLGKMGYRFFGSPRGLVSETTGLTIARCRDIDIPKLVIGGNTDIGVCSGATLGEFDGEVIKLIDVPFGKRQLLVYVNQLTTQIKSVEDLKGKGIGVQTSWPNTARKYCSEQNIDPTISKMYGSGPLLHPDSIGIEYMQPTDVGNLGEDYTVVDQRESQSGALIANPRSYERYRDRIDGFAHRLKMAFEGEGWRLLKFNVPESDLEKVRRYLPSMKGPTYANLLGEPGWCAVETALPNGEIEVVVSNLRRNTRAMGFLDQEVGGVEV